MKPVIVFDLDDTLYKEVDYVESAFSAIADSLSEYGIDKKRAKDTMTAAFSGGMNPIDAVIGNFDQPYSERELVEIYRKHKPSIRLGRDAEKALSVLKDKGFDTALITDGRSVAQRNKIEALGLGRFFPKTGIFISEETGADKTKPDNFVAVERMYISSDKFFYVGDNTEKDFTYPNKMGWTTVCVKDNGKNIHAQNFDAGGASCPKYIVNDLDELLEIVDKFF